MDSDDELIDVAFLALCKMYDAIKKSRGRKRRWNVRPINKDWASSGYQRQVFSNMKTMDEEQHFIHTRMTRPVFEKLVKLVAKSLKKPRQRIPVEERLSLTLLYLSHGTSIQCIASSYMLGKTTVRNIVLETCDALWRILSPIYVSEPATSQYCDIEKDFHNMWNMPNCVGAIDGKHIALKCPAKNSPMFFNDKKIFRIVLMASCDAKYRFTALSIGSYGSQSDLGIFAISPFGQALMSNTLPLPANKPFSSDSSQPFPHFFVGDTTFPLRRNLMRPYPGTNLDRKKRIFNSRARRIAENCFGILTARWRVLLQTIECNPNNVEKIVLACIALHNFLMHNDQQRWYCPENYVDWEGADNVVHEGDWRRDLHDVESSLRPMSSSVRRGSKSAYQLRDKLAEYFVNEGAVPFQDRIDAVIHGPYS